MFFDLKWVPTFVQFDRGRTAYGCVGGPACTKVGTHFRDLAMRSSAGSFGAPFGCIPPMVEAASAA